MSIRVKLYMSYLAMAIVPVILFFLLMLFLYVAGGEQDMREFLEAKENENFNQAIVYGELSYVIREDAGRLEDPLYVESLQSRLHEQWAGLILAKNGEVTEVAPFLKELAPDEDWKLVVSDNPQEMAFHLYRFTTNGIDFRYPDGSDGQAVLLRRTEQVPIFWHPLGFAAGLLCVILSSLLLTYFVSRSIIRPLQSLRTAALRIKEGDLGHPLVIRGKCRSNGFGRNNSFNEIAQVGAAFEDMRIRLKDSIEQSLQYEENRKLLLSHISHDLKTPISAIKGYVEGIMDGIANTDDMRRRYIATVYRKATDMDQLIDELFLFSKLDLQKVAYDFKVVDIGRYVEDFMGEQRFELEKEGVRLSCEVPRDTPLPVAADPDKLNRVFANILNNSVKYMVYRSDSGENSIAVKVRDGGDGAWITIEDTGPGIDAEDLPFIFDRFYRAEQSRNSETGGSGLGLAIVKQIIEGHGGEVRAENTESGGARFTLRLPKSTPVKAVSEHEKHSDH